jgi:hypothetical protein
MKAKQLSEWKLIEFLNWADNNSDISALTARCIAKVGNAGWEDLSMFVKKKVGELQTAIKTYEEKNGDLDIGSDDGFSDVCYHIVGLGKEEFNRCIKDPKLVEKRYNSPYGSYEGYRESFAYMFLDDESNKKNS